MKKITETEILNKETTKTKQSNKTKQKTTKDKHTIQ